MANDIIWDDQLPDASGIVWDDAAKPKEEKKQTLVGMLPKWLGAPLDTVATLASGAVAPVAAGLAGIAGATLPGPPGQGADWVKTVQDALTHHPETGLARGVEQAVSLPVEYGFMRPGARAGQIAENLGAPPSVSTAIQTAIQGAPAYLPFAAKMAGMDSPYSVTGSEAAREAQRVANSQLDAETLRAKAAGFDVPPVQANPDALLPSIAQGFAGKANVERRVSLNTQPTFQVKTRAQFGMPEDAPLTPGALDAVRSAAHAEYEAVRDTGQIKPGVKYFQTLDQIAKPVVQAVENFPDPTGALPSVAKDIAALAQPEFSADAAITKIAELRTKATQLYAAGNSKDTALAGTYKDLANALEQEIGRHLERTNQPQEILTNFQNARKKIAQVYTMENALLPSGEVNVKSLATALNNGTPLEGNMLDMAQYGAQFPKGSQIPSRLGGNTTSQFADVLLGLIGGGKVGASFGGVPGFAAGTALAAARPLTASFLAGPYQKFLSPSDYGPSLANRAMSTMQDPTTGLGLSALGLESEDEKRRKALAQTLGFGQ